MSRDTHLGNKTIKNEIYWIYWIPISVYYSTVKQLFLKIQMFIIKVFFFF